MGFMAACTSLTLTAGTNLFVRGDVSIRQSNDFKARYLAGDTLFIVPIKKLTREMRITALIADFGVINTLAGILVNPEKWTFTITDHDTTALKVDGTNTMVGYLKSMDYKLLGTEYDVELTWVIGK